MVSIKALIQTVIVPRSSLFLLAGRSIPVTSSLHKTRDPARSHQSTTCTNFSPAIVSLLNFHLHCMSMFVCAFTTASVFALLRHTRTSPSPYDSSSVSDHVFCFILFLVRVMRIFLATLIYFLLSACKLLFCASHQSRVMPCRVVSCRAAAYPTIMCSAVSSLRLLPLIILIVQRICLIQEKLEMSDVFSQ